MKQKSLSYFVLICLVSSQEIFVEEVFFPEMPMHRRDAGLAGESQIGSPKNT